MLSQASFPPLHLAQSSPSHTLGKLHNSTAAVCRAGAPSLCSERHAGVRRVACSDLPLLSWPRALLIAPAATVMAFSTAALTLGSSPARLRGWS